MNEEKVIQMLINHEDRLKRIEENMVTKTEYRADRQKFMKTLDEILGIVKKKDQELTMMGSRVQRLDKKVERHDTDIKQIKPMLGLA